MQVVRQRLLEKEKKNTLFNFKRAWMEIQGDQGGGSL